MSQMQDATTNRLVTVIQAILLERTTGLLHVKRGEGITKEEGSILFTEGQVTQAKVGRRTGPEALNWLSTWGVCRYVFIASQEPRSTQPLPVNVPSTPAHMEPRLLAHTPQTPPPLEAVVRVKIPIRTKNLDEGLRLLEQKGLSRAHRLLLFYIDGVRAPEALARLLRSSEQEVQQLLHDLEHIELIRTRPDPPSK